MGYGRGTKRLRLGWMGGGLSDNGLWTERSLWGFRA